MYRPDIETVDFQQPAAAQAASQAPVTRGIASSAASTYRRHAHAGAHGPGGVRLRVCIGGRSYARHDAGSEGLCGDVQLTQRRAGPGTRHTADRDSPRPTNGCVIIATTRHAQDLADAYLDASSGANGDLMASSYSYPVVARRAWRTGFRGVRGACLPRAGQYSLPH